MSSTEPHQVGISDAVRATTTTYEGARPFVVAEPATPKEHHPQAIQARQMNLAIPSRSFDSGVLVTIEKKYNDKEHDRCAYLLDKAEWVLDFFEDWLQETTNACTVTRCIIIVIIVVPVLMLDGVH